jgi:hypothetical protein
MYLRATTFGFKRAGAVRSHALVARVRVTWGTSMGCAQSNPALRRASVAYKSVGVCDARRFRIKFHELISNSVRMSSHAKMEIQVFQENQFDRRSCNRGCVFPACSGDVAQRRWSCEQRHCLRPSSESSSAELLFAGWSELSWELPHDTRSRVLAPKRGCAWTTNVCGGSFGCRQRKYVERERGRHDS